MENKNRLMKNTGLCENTKKNKQVNEEIKQRLARNKQNMFKKSEKAIEESEKTSTAQVQAAYKEAEQKRGGGGKRRNKSLKRMKLKRNISLKGGRKRQLKKNIRKTLKKKKRVSSFKLKNLKIQSKARRNRNTLKKRK